MLVLTKDQNIFFLDFKKQFNLTDKGVDINPIPIKNDLFILGEEVLADERCADLKQALIDGGHLQKVEIREVLTSEFIEYTI